MKDDKLWVDIMKEVDTDKNNEISMEEFMNVMTAYTKQSSIAAIAETNPYVKK